MPDGACSQHKAHRTKGQHVLKPPRLLPSMGWESFWDPPSFLVANIAPAWWAPSSCNHPLSMQVLQNQNESCGRDCLKVTKFDAIRRDCCFVLSLGTTKLSFAEPCHALSTSPCGCLGLECCSGVPAAHETLVLFRIITSLYSFIQVRFLLH